MKRQSPEEKNRSKLTLCTDLGIQSVRKANTIFKAEGNQQVQASNDWTKHAQKEFKRIN